jgi:hypothetical protein
VDQADLVSMLVQMAIDLKQVGLRMQLRDEAWAALERTKPQLPEMFQGREKELLETYVHGPACREG